MKGWISLHRKILDNPILSYNRVFSRFEAFIWLLLHANYKDKNIPIGATLYKVKKGEIITSQMKLCKRFKWGNSKLRNFLKLLQDDNMIILKTETKLTRITLLNYDTYQENQIDNKLKVNDKQIDNKLSVNINNNNNNNNKVNNINKRKIKFINQVLAEGLKHIPMIEPNILEDFNDYWTEPNKSGTKMRFELQQTFHISRRLNRWIRNDFNKSNKINSNSFKYDATGKFVVGYCENCNKSDFYDPFQLNKQDSKCCSKQILDIRKN